MPAIKEFYLDPRNGQANFEYDDGTTKVVGLDQSPVSGASGDLPPYLGNIATRCRVPSERSITGEVYFNSRSYHTARDDATDVQVVLPNFAALTSATSPTNNGELGAGGATQFTATLAGPDGVRKQVIFGGSATGTAADNSFLIGNCAITVKRGDKLTLRVWGATAGTGICYTKVGALSNTYTVYGEALALSSTPLADLTVTGDVTNTANAGKMFYPCAILATTSRPSVMIFGDSRYAGAIDTSDASGHVGHAERVIGRKYPFINCSVQGERVFFVQTAASNRIALAAYVSHILWAHGINDVNAGASAVNTLGYMAAVRALAANVKPSLKQFQATVYPNATSTDSFATTANQTVTAGNTARVSLNNSIRTTQLANSAGFVDVADAVESYRDSGVFVANGQAGYYTSDGLHLKREGELYASKVVDLLPALGLS